MPARQKLLVAGLILLAFTIAYWGKSYLPSEQSATNAASRTSKEAPGDRRIVSLAPSITEILYALGQGGQVVGVTRYCNYPPEARTKTRIGGYFDLNYEAVVELDPTLIIMLAQHVKAREYFGGIGYEILVVDHLTMEGIIDSFELIGKACECESQAMELTTDIEDQMEKILSPIRGRPLKRTMIAVDRSKSRSLEQIYIAGNDGFFNKMIELAGGINVYDGNVPFPAISAEGIIQMNPEIIIELVPETTLQRSSVEELTDDWASLTGVKAVEDNRVFFLTKNYVSIPGPRFILTLQDIVRLLHPEES
jgi:iron complex transport system substrate-binding protein